MSTSTSHFQGSPAHCRVTWATGVEAGGASKSLAGGGRGDDPVEPERADLVAAVVVARRDTSGPLWKTSPYGIDLAPADPDRRRPAAVLLTCSSGAAAWATGWRRGER